MKQILIILTFILIGCQSNQKLNKVDFTTIVFDLDNAKDSIDFAQWKKTHLINASQPKTDTLFSMDTIPVGELYFSDNKYIVYGYCMGEFGGALMFQNRELMDSIYYLECTCPVMIDKRKDGYYITESLAHGSGFGKVRYFKSPKELNNIQLDSLLTNWKIMKYPGLNDYEIWRILETQGKILVDTIGLTFSIFFPLDNQNYLIYSDFNNTYLGIVSSDTLVQIDTLLNIPTWRTNDLSNEIINGYYHYNFSRRSGQGNDKIIKWTFSSGDIYAKGDSIVIAYKFRETTENK